MRHHYHRGVAEYALLLGLVITVCAFGLWLWGAAS